MTAIELTSPAGFFKAMSHKNRGRIICSPITSRWDHQTHANSVPKQFEPLALIVGYDGGTVAEGVIVRHRLTGTLAKWMGFHLENIDPRKAEAALARMAEQK